MSTNTQPTPTGSVLRRQKDGSRALVPAPQSVISYNKYMGGVDRGDQLRSYYSCRTKCRKFYKYIFHFLFDVAITNAYILQQHFTPHTFKRSIKDFRLQLARDLIANYCTRRRPGRGGGATIRSLRLRHFPVKVSDGSSPPKHKRGCCAHCIKSSHTRKDTCWFCKECGVWLCHTGGPNDCFLLWHTQHVEQ